MDTDPFSEKDRIRIRLLTRSDPDNLSMGQDPCQNPGFLISSDPDPFILDGRIWVFIYRRSDPNLGTFYSDTRNHAYNQVLRNRILYTKKDLFDSYGTWKIFRASWNLKYVAVFNFMFGLNHTKI